jgi:hypothetical protein
MTSARELVFNTNFFALVEHLSRPSNLNQGLPAILKLPSSQRDKCSNRIKVKWNFSTFSLSNVTKPSVRACIGGPCNRSGPINSNCCPQQLSGELNILDLLENS